MRIEAELPDDDRLEWVLSAMHEHGLRLCNDVACIRALSWRRLQEPAHGDQP